MAQRDYEQTGVTPETSQKDPGAYVQNRSLVYVVVALVVLGSIVFSWLS